MTLSRIWIAVLCFLSLVCLGISVYLFIRPPVETQPHTAYLLRDYQGKLAAYTPDSSDLVEVYQVYTHLLPAQDVLSLQQGIPVENREQLDRLLEDFGL